MTVDINNPVQPPLYFTVALDGLSRLTVTTRTDLAGYCFQCYAPQANATSERGCILFEGILSNVDATVDLNGISVFKCKLCVCIYTVHWY